MRFFGRIRTTYFLLPVIPIVHVQIGAIAVVLFGLSTLTTTISARTARRSELVSLSAGILTVILGLTMRPIAGNPTQFSEICRVLIPHHCYAPSWTNETLHSSVLLLVLVLLGSLLTSSEVMSLHFKLAVIALPSLILATTLILDRFFDGPFVNLVRGNNVYRFAVVLLPWAYLCPALLSARRTTNIFRFLPAAVYSFVFVLLLTRSDTQSQFSNNAASAVLLVGVALLLSQPTTSNRRRTSHIAISALIAAVVIGALSTPIILGERKLSFPDTRFGVTSMNVEGTNYADIGTEIAASSFDGSVIAGDPLQKWVRLASGRAYAVDCKFRPIGGGPPLAEFFRRLEPLGGYEGACLQHYFASATPDELENYAVRSAADFLLIQAGDERIPKLGQRGWRDESTPGLTTNGFILLRSPS